MAHVMRHDAGISRRHYEPVAEGERAERSALLLMLLGVPGAALAWQLWSHVVVGPGADVNDVHYTGWTAVSVLLPASLLVVALAVAAVVQGARAVAAHVRAGEPVLASSAVVLLLVLSVLGTSTADEVQDGASSQVLWTVRLVALAVTGAVAGWARWWAHRTGA